MAPAGQTVPMAQWAQLTDWLRTADDRVLLTWPQLEAIVGPLPPSAARHRAFWSGDRPHVRAWKAAGYTASGVAMGQHVTFVRDRIPRGSTTTAQVSLPNPAGPANGSSGADLLLVTCVKSKRPTPAAAKDLYTSPLFRKERAYAEASGLPWFILSAEHGLVQPEQWLAPYRRYLPDPPSSYQLAWGQFVVERLELLTGPLEGKRVEVHASHVYVEAIRVPLESKAATVLTPLAGLPQGQRLQWYDQHEGGRLDASPDSDGSIHPDVASFVGVLREEDQAVPPRTFLAQRRSDLSSPGLYSWWVDATGAKDLSTGLGHQVKPALIYAGLAGATRWPSGRRSTNTLWSRIAGMHLGGRHEFSTFRRTLGSILAAAAGADDIDEERLTEWMHEHLRVIAVPHDDPDTLGRLESEVLEQLDPPLNLQGRPRTPLRARLTELRRPHS